MKVEKCAYCGELHQQEDESLTFAGMPIKVCPNHPKDEPMFSFAVKGNLLKSSLETAAPLTAESFERGAREWQRRAEAQRKYRIENGWKPRMVLSDQMKRDLVSIGIDPAETFDLVEPITLSELMEDNPLDENVID